MTFETEEAKKKDAALMLNWMHDSDTVRFLKKDFMNKTIEDCISFIENETPRSIDFAIVSDNDEYMGTVSLKNIRNKTAEFGIVIRKAAMGKGYSGFAIEKITEYGFKELGLSCIYWYVSAKNSRALKFYDRCKYDRVSVTDVVEKVPFVSPEILKEETYIWYMIAR